MFVWILRALMMILAKLHEGYPGHHTEFLLKEVLLYEGRGYAEHMIGLLVAPMDITARNNV